MFRSFSVTHTQYLAIRRLPIPEVIDYSCILYGPDRQKNQRVNAQDLFNVSRSCGARAHAGMRMPLYSSPYSHIAMLAIAIDISLDMYMYSN